MRVSAKWRSVCFGGVMALGWVLPVAAQDRSALVIANSAYPAEAALPNLRQTGLQVSETLLGLGFQVQRLENPTGDQMTAAIAEVTARDGVTLIYYAGYSVAEDGRSLLLPVDLDAEGVAVSTLLTPSDAPRFVLLDVCHEEVTVALDGTEPEPGPLSPDLVDAVESGQNLFVAAPGLPGDVCGAGPLLADGVLAQLTTPGLTTDQLQPGAGFVQSSLAVPFVFRTATSDVRLTAADYAMLDNLSPAARAQMIDLWSSAGIPVDIAGVAAQPATAPLAPAVGTVVVAAPVRPVAAATLIAPIDPRAASTAVATVTDGVSLVASGTAAPAPAIFRATPGEGGLPAPSILVGFATDDTAPEIADEALGGTGLGYEDRDAREALRSEDPELFASLLDAGAFDPPSPELARAIQTELARMNCYTSGIDGIWGPGSRRSVTRYYEEIDASSPSQDPVAEIFRAIIARDDVRCPNIVAAPAPARPAATRTTTTRAPAPAPARRAAPAPAPAPAPAAPARRTITRSTGTGVFR